MFSFWGKTSALVALLASIATKLFPIHCHIINIKILKYHFPTVCTWGVMQLLVNPIWSTILGLSLAQLRVKRLLIMSEFYLWQMLYPVFVVPNSFFKKIGMCMQKQRKLVSVFHWLQIVLTIVKKSLYNLIFKILIKVRSLFFIQWSYYSWPS